MERSPSCQDCLKKDIENLKLKLIIRDLERQVDQGNEAFQVMVVTVKMYKEIVQKITDKLQTLEGKSEEGK